MISIPAKLATELEAKEQQVNAAIALLDEGATVPFIARYRKEVTGGLDDTQLRKLAERLVYFRELNDRKLAILKSIEEQGKLTPELQKAIDSTDSKTRLEDLYLPYKPKRRTKGQIAIEAGLEPLADFLLSTANANPQTEAAKYANTEAGFSTEKEILDGAKYILMERFSENADLLASLRQKMQQEAELSSKVAPGKEAEGEKFKDYFDYTEAFHKIPSHRALALFRGRKEGILSCKLDLPENPEASFHACEVAIAKAHELAIFDELTARTQWLREVVKWTWRIKLQLQIETDLLGDLRGRAEDDAISVFATNLKDLLLAAPAGGRPTLGLDPGLRTGVKVAVIDGTGAFIDQATIYPHAPRNQWDQSLAILAALCQKHKVELIAIGNGTASRETDKLARELAKRFTQQSLTPVMVSEAGASVYSASELAAKEFPNVDVSIRGAISIARRLQDPLAELVKIEPKAIGVGQYQHDVSQTKLARSLDDVIEDCVNAVGVELNTASAPLLSRVAGISSAVATNIVAFRTEHGAIKSRAALKSVPRLGEKAFEQCAGFLRIRDSENPLDNSAVHPESYNVVSDIAAANDSNVEQLIGNATLLKSVNARQFVSESTGELTIKDILSELEKPGLDPRPEFVTAKFNDTVETMADLKPDQVLEGVVTNVTNFGAFVDIGVHQDGLVHISALSENFVKDPHAVVKTGQVVKVKVMEVDVQRKRIGLSMRLSDSAADVVKSERTSSRGANRNKSFQQKPSNAGGGGLAAAFANAKVKKR